MNPVQPEDGSSANDVLTIDTRRIGDLFLPAEREDRAAFEYMDKLCSRVWGKSTFPAANRARTHVRIAWNDTVKVITERGGLLLIGGAQ